MREKLKHLFVICHAWNPIFSLRFASVCPTLCNLCDYLTNLCPYWTSRSGDSDWFLSLFYLCMVSPWGSSSILMWHLTLPRVGDLRQPEQPQFLLWPGLPSDTLSLSPFWWLQGATKFSLCAWRGEWDPYFWRGRVWKSPPFTRPYCVLVTWCGSRALRHGSVHVLYP